MQWLYLKYLKALYPLNIYEYVVANNINEDTEFNWWIKDALRIRYQVISRIECCGVYAPDIGQGGSKKKYWCTTHKFGIEVLKTVQDNLDIDSKRGTDFWEKNIRKEMTNVRIEFENIDGMTPEQMRTGKIKPGYKYFSTHMIFYIKIGGKFASKDILVADAHNTDAPASIIY